MTLATAKRLEVGGRATRKAAFPTRMETLMPWAEFCALVEPHYARMLRRQDRQHQPGASAAFT